MIEIVIKSLRQGGPIVRFRKTTGGHINAFGGGKVKYQKGSHYTVPVSDKHPYNVITDEVLNND